MAPARAPTRVLVTAVMMPGSAVIMATGANNDQTNFYTCASCGAGGAGNLGSGMLMIAGVALVLRRRRRS